MKKVAVIGSGIAGISTCHYLKKLGYEVSLFESGDHFGGHTHTHQITLDEQTFPVDTGFLVHNDRTYPNLINFFEELGIEAHESDMSFSVFAPKENLMWAGTNLFTVFGQLKNLISPRFFFFVKEILRFNKKSDEYLKQAQEFEGYSLGDLLSQENYSDDFKYWYLLPMGGCIWSTPTDKMLEFPAHSFLRFCMNHGLLQVTNRPQWKTVVGGCSTYVTKVLETVDHKYLGEGTDQVIPNDDGVTVTTTKGNNFHFDACFMCSHPPETLKMLSKWREPQKAILESFQYQKNTAVLHYDDSVLPEKRFWSAWNYLAGDRDEPVSVTYLINKLQPLPTKKPILVSLNPITKIDSSKVIKSIEYEHPLFDDAAVSAQEKMSSLQGKGNLYFSGAWMRYGFHEDGILSAKRSVNDFLNNSLNNSQEEERRSSDLLDIL